MNLHIHINEASSVQEIDITIWWVISCYVCDVSLFLQPSETYCKFVKFSVVSVLL